MITIVLPHPPAPLRPNARRHWRSKAQAVKAYRKLAQMRALEALAMRNPPMWEKAKVIVVWRSTTKRVPDPDCVIASMKSAFDGLQDAGIIENDKGLWPERPIIETKAHWPEVVLQIEEE